MEEIWRYKRPHGEIPFEKFTDKRLQKWFPKDDEENFLKQSQEHQDYWNANPFNYYFNEHGHRCESINLEANNILFLGCSLTFGVGMPKEKCWTYLVSKELGKREINFGIPGGSLDGCYRMYRAWQYELKIPTTVLLIPPGMRLEFDKKTRYIRYGTWSRGVYFTKEIDNWIFKHLFHKKAWNMARDKTLNAIKWIAHETGSRLIIIDSVDLLQRSYDELLKLGYMEKTVETDHKGFVNYSNLPKARDGAHPGEIWHKHVTMEILDEIRRNG